MNQPALHDLFRPRIDALLSEALAAGYARDVALAVLIDVVTGSDLNTAAPSPETPLPHGPWPRPTDDSAIEAEVELENPDPNLLGSLRP